MKNQNSLNSFLSVVENKHPQILPLITSKNEYFVEIEMPYNQGKTFAEQSEFLNPILTPSQDMPIRQAYVSFNEKQEYFKIVVKLN